MARETIGSSGGISFFVGSNSSPAPAAAPSKSSAPSSSSSSGGGGSSGGSSSGVNYNNLVNVGGTIYNKNGPTANTTADGGYASEAALARDLGTSAASISWNSISSGSKPATAAPPVVTPPIAPPVNTPPTNTPTSTGDPTLDALLARLDKMIQDQAAAGNKVNPNIELTPATIKQFLDQATAEVEPYYANQINVIKNDLHSNLDNLQQNYDVQKQQNETQFKQDLSTKRETLANTGLAYSGFRGQQEQALAGDQTLKQQQIATNAAKAAQDAISSTESKVGSRNLDGLLAKGAFTQYASSLAGQGGFNPSKTLDFGTTGGVTGSLEYSKAADIRNLSDYLKSQEIQKRTLNFA